MNREVILIYPKLAKQPMAEKPLLPIPLLALAGPLEQQGVTVRIMDENVEDVYEQLSCIDTSPICFGISCMVGYQIRSGLNIARAIRKLWPDCPIVWGGWFPTLLPETTIGSTHADILVKGKGEVIFAELVEAIFEGRSLEDVQGLVYKKNGEIIETPDRPLDDPNTFPRTPYHLLDLSRYRFSDGMANYTSSYGCPFRCGFCGITRGLKRKWNKGLSPERVLDELEELVRTHGIKHVIFHEDNFCCDPRRAKAIWKGMVERGLKVTWEANTRIDQMVRFDADMLETIKAADGSEISDRSSLNVGVESTVQTMLDFIQKDISVEQVEKAVQMAKQYDLPLLINIIAGLPTETPATYMETLRKMKSFMDDYPRLRIVIYPYVPVPGTALYDFEKKEGRVHVLSSLERWADATEDVFDIHEHNKKIEKYTNRIFRIITYHFRYAHLFSRLPKRNRGPIGRFLVNMVRASSAFRFEHDFWLFPIEYDAVRLRRSFLRRAAAELRKMRNRRNKRGAGVA